ncbi:MAG: Trm112 family protein [Acidobacteriota bacterium]|nr:Trm112 family protein [Acidobacteriota bacterium]
MAISQDLVEIMICPACKGKVELKADGSAIKCVACRRVYPIRNDIPSMLVEEATIEDETVPPQR